MKISTNFYLLALIIILLMVITFDKCTRETPEPSKPEIVYEYITDTIFKEKYHQLLKEVGTITPPKTITRWKTPTPGKDIIIEKIPDSLMSYITELEERMGIAQGFFLTYPNNPKLIELDLSRDKLNLTTMSTDGYVDEYEYPLYLNNFKYNWQNNQLQRFEVKYDEPKIKVKKPSKFTNLYLTTGYDYFNKNNTIGLDYNLDIWRFRLGLENKVILQKVEDNMQFNIKLGYKILK